MDRKQLLWQMSAEQFAAFDTQLYLDTHPNDRNALQLLREYQKNYMKCKREYETMFGLVDSDNTSYETWCWVNNPWPWEREAN